MANVTERERARRREPVRRRRLVALACVVLVAAMAALVVGARVGAGRTPSSFAVGLRTIVLVDRTRSISLPDGTTVPRTLVTYVRYPAHGSARGIDRRGAPAARSDGPFPLVVFGHGFAVTPAQYARLLDSWARAGYVVAAPVFPVENANAPGGPDRSDVINQPADMRFVISRLLRANAAASGPLAGLIDPQHIAVAGQSDGGETALAVAYDSQERDPRVGAAVILSGAEMPGLGGLSFPAGSPPLLAAQGTADTLNLPSNTSAFLDAASRPKYLLSLLGAGHLPPYSDQQPQLRVVEATTIAFLDAYLEQRPESLQRLASLGGVPGIATLRAEP
jgi:dienelactone hydrolase